MPLLRVPEALCAAFAVCAAVLPAPTSPARAATVGVAAAVNQSATSVQPGQAVRSISLGDNVVQNERIATNDVGLAQLLLADGTAFTIGPRSDLVIDRFVYDPARNEATVAASFSKGVLRFVGGRTSKTGGATVSASFGTIGIRGGSGVITDLPPGSQGNLPTQRIDATIGVMTLNGQDVPAGQSAWIGEGGSIAVGPTPPAATAANNANLAGTPGTSGGSPNKPTDGQAAAVSSGNSETSPASVEAGIVTGVGSGPGDEDQVVTDSSQDTTRDDVVEETENPPVEARTIRVLTAGSTYVVLDNPNNPVSDPGSAGLVGGSSNTDQSVDLEIDRSGATPTGTADLVQGDLVLPFYEDAVSQTHAISGLASPFGTLNGTAYSGPGDFAAYLLHVGNDVTDPLYAVTGTSTDAGAVLYDNDPSLRTYSFSEDPIQQIPVPFELALTQTIFVNATVTPIYILEQPNASSVTPIFAQASLGFAGQGANQQSLIAVNIGGLDELGDGAGLDMGRRGSYRYVADEQAFATRGSLATLSDGDGGDHFYGPNAENFVLSANFGLNDSMGDSPMQAQPGGPGDFSTIHVATLQSETSLSSFDRTSRVLTGFAAGVMEGAFRDVNGDPVPFAPVPVMNDLGVNGVKIDLIAETSTIGGTISVRETISNDSDIDGINVAFGFGVDGNTSGGGSAMLDDDRFLARQNSDRTESYAIDNSSVVRPQVDDQNPGTYMMSYDMAPDDSFMPAGEDVCACEFLKWGWWGTDLRLADPNGNPSREDARVGVHLGTWAAGEVSDPDDLPATGTASYDGHAVGTVIADQGGGSTAQYVAGGDMDMTWDFATRSGRVDITNFDNHNFGADVEDPFNNAQAQNPTSGFTSDFTTQSTSFDGTINGSFVDDGPNVAAGVIGNFGVNDTTNGWRASGIFVGEQ